MRVCSNPDADGWLTPSPRLYRSSTFLISKFRRHLYQYSDYLCNSAPDLLELPYNLSERLSGPTLSSTFRRPIAPCQRIRNGAAHDARCRCMDRLLKSIQPRPARTRRSARDACSTTLSRPSRTADWPRSWPALPRPSRSASRSAVFLRSFEMRGRVNYSLAPLSLERM